MTHIFIINPFAGQKTFADDIRTKLSAMTDLNYFVFNTRYEGYEAELVRKIRQIFEGEKLRFYCCGGSGTMHKMLGGFDDLSEAEIAFFPCGLTNDFLKMFGKDEPRFSNIEELIHGDIIKVDYIHTNHGISLNTLSTGLDSNCVDKMNEFRILRFLGQEMPYFVSTLYSIFVSKTLDYEITVDDVEFNGKSAEVFIGNGCIFGGNMFFAESTCIDDGKAVYRIAPDKRGFSLLPILTAVTGKKHEKVKQLMQSGECRKITIRRADGLPFTINLDGDLVKNITEVNAEIVHQGLSFVVPKGVRA